MVPQKSKNNNEDVKTSRITDIERLKKSLSFIEEKLNALDCNDNCDPAEVNKCMQDKLDAENLLNILQKELKEESFRFGTFSQTAQNLFEDGNKNYSAISSSYIRKS